ncbi:MAG: cytosine permease [Firmicutes bacterium]|nr:cytosine permease [Bacillota bacterium]
MAEAKALSVDANNKPQEDFPLTRVPTDARYHWFSIAIMRIGQLGALSQFLLGATLGYSMSFWHAFWAFTLGAVILEIVSAFTGWIGMKEGLQTSLLARWTGFGEIGAGIAGLVVGVSIIGWFGVQNAVFALGVQQLLGLLPVWAWSIITGAIVVFIVYHGFMTMGWTAYIAVPAFVVVMLVAIGRVFAHHSFGQLVAALPPGPHMSIATGASLVAGGFMVGGVISPDMTRFNRSVGDVFKQTILGFTIGEYTIGMIGVLLASALKSTNVITLTLATTGFIGVMFVLLATVKINDFNLYSAGLGIINAIEIIFHRRLSRRKTTVVIGALGIVMSALGILNHFINFLSLLSVAIPPIASIMIVDYFFLKRQRHLLDETREEGTLPRVVERWNPVALIAWATGFVVGQQVTMGIPSINSLAASAIVYYIGSLVVSAVRRDPQPLFSPADSSRLTVMD